MNILFANYGDYSTNSLNHIAAFANYLSEHGHSCIVAVPSNLASVERLPKALFQTATFKDVLSVPNHFPNSRPADILHAWTPRINVTDFTRAYLASYPSKLVTHLEDNEFALIESFYRTPLETLRRKGLPKDFTEWDHRLPHPVESTADISLSDGITVITESLGELAFPDQPSIELLPGLPEPPALLPENSSIREKFGLDPNEILVVYPGGITSSNREDVRTLYLAIRLLQERGHKIRLVKTGPNNEQFRQSFGWNLNETVLDLGIVSKTEIFELLKVADLLIQPGRADKLNSYRLPSKLPEFLQAGKPVITARTNIGLRMAEGENCLFIQDSSPQEIAGQCERILASPDLAKTLSAGAKSFAKEHFDLTRNAQNLLGFYRQLLEKTKRHWNPPAQSDSTFSASLANRLSSLSCSREIDQEWREQHLGRFQDLANTLSQSIKSESKRAQNLQEKLSLALESSHQERLARKRELESLRKERAQLEQRTRTQISSLENEIEQARQQAAEIEDSKRRLKKTASWKATAPLRALRRNLVDPFTRQKTNTTENASEVFDPETDSAETENPQEAIAPNFRDYSLYLERLSPLVEEYKENFLKRLPSIKQPPLISVLLPVYNVPTKWLQKAIDSVIGQIYPHWELIIVDDASPNAELRQTIEHYAQDDSRIKFHFREENGHISKSSNDALERASGDFIALLDHDDEIASHALARIADAIINNPEANLIYTDEDKIDENGVRFSPHFKSDWNPDLLNGQNYISHLGAYRRSVVAAIGGFRVGFEGAQDWDLALRVSEASTALQIIHIPEALYHWRTISGSTATDISEKDYAHEAGRRALQDAFDRKGLEVTLEPIERYYWRVRYPSPNPLPKVSLVIPTRNRIELLRACIDSVREKTTYPHYEIIIADNDSDNLETLDYLATCSKSGIKVIPCPGKFNFSAITNRAIKHADGDIICLLNNDITVITPTWLEELASQAARLEIGAVGAKLYYPHDHIQHAGIVLGIGGVGNEAFKKVHRSDDGYIHRALLVGNYSAVTGACMAFRKNVWSEVGGLNDDTTPNAYSDVDFCLRIKSAGYRILYTPFAELYHHESASRGRDDTHEKQKEFTRASDFMLTRWAEQIKRDPFYNPNLTLCREDFCLSEHPRLYSTS